MKKVFNNQDFFDTIIDVLNHEESVSFFVKGSSMNPFFLNQQTEVFIRTKPFYQPKDVCLFKYGQKVLLHRLIRIKNGMYFFRGDHLYTYEKVEKEAILGYVYQMKTNEKMTRSIQVGYRLKVNLYLFYKKCKMIIRYIYRGVRYGCRKKR